MATLDENQVIGLTSDALGATLPAHRSFEARHQADGATARGIRRIYTSSRRHTSSEHEVAAESPTRHRTPSTFLDRNAAARGLQTSGAAYRAPFSHECSTRCDGTNADLVEVVVDPPSTAIVEGDMRTSSSEHCRVPTQMMLSMQVRALLAL